MPTISLFYGIIIKMYYNDNKRHHTPHFHAVYGDEEVVMSLECEVLEGSLPYKKLELVKAWTIIHEEDLKADWKLAVSGEVPFKIEPLK